jgi:nicotinamide phosphoribosyltransferase
MLAPGTTRLYGTWIPRSVKHAPKGVTKIVSFGQQMAWRWIHDEFEENFFNAVELEYTKGVDEAGRPYYLPTGKVINKGIEPALKFAKDMSLYLGQPYDGEHFEQLWKLGYLPVKIKSLPEGIETAPNIPHMTFINTENGFGWLVSWLTLYLETITSSVAWKPSTAATIAKAYRRQAEEWVRKTDPTNMWLVDWMCHDFSARGLDPMSQYLIGLGHATSFKGSDTLPVIPAARYFYNEPEDEVCVGSVNASEHSVSTTKIFTVGEQQMIADWLQLFRIGILSIVADTFDLWVLITEYLPANKEAIMARDGKLVIRPDSGDPVDIICGVDYITFGGEFYKKEGTFVDDNRLVTNNKPISINECKGVIELLWDIFGGTVNDQGYKVLDPHIGAIYGDSITIDRQKQIYERLAAKGFAATNIVLGIGSFTYQYNTRDTLGFAAKGAWFEVAENRTHNDNGRETEWEEKVSYNIYKDPVTDDGTKKSLKGLLQVFNNNPNCQGNEMLFDGNDDFKVNTECTPEEESGGILQLIYEDGKFYNQITLTEIRERLSKI